MHTVLHTLQYCTLLYWKFYCTLYRLHTHILLNWRAPYTTHLTAHCTVQCTLYWRNNFTLMCILYCTLHCTLYRSLYCNNVMHTVLTPLLPTVLHTVLWTYTITAHCIVHCTAPSTEHCMQYGLRWLKSISQRWGVASYVTAINGPNASFKLFEEPKI